MKNQNFYLTPHFLTEKANGFSSTAFMFRVPLRLDAHMGQGYDKAL
jgi:hypothetical protein